MSAGETVDRLLAATLRGDSRLPAAGDIDAGVLRHRLRLHGIAGLLMRREDCLAHWPEPMRRMVAGEARLLGIWEETHREVLFPLLADFAAAGIAVMVLKGTALAHAFYPEPALRARGDTDLLIRPCQLGLARERLALLGFVRKAGMDTDAQQEIWEKPSGFGLCHAIDLHWQSHPRPAMEALLPAQELFARSVPVHALPGEARRPATAHMLMACVINHASHTANGFTVDGVAVRGERRLGWIVDVHLLAGAMDGQDWEALVTLALAAGMAESVSRALDEAHRLLATPVPDSVMARLQACARSDVIVQYHDPRRPWLRPWLDWRAARRTGQRWRAIRLHALPGKSVLLANHPGYPDLPVPLLQLLRLAGFAWRRLRGAS